MMYQMARMSVEDGLVMTIHPGSYRNHHEPTFNQFGADTGHDIPFAINYTEAIRPLLQDFGTAKDFHLVLFTMDETVFSRELAPLAGFYPSVYLGAPWWFLDAPDAMLRFRSAVTETAGFSRSSGFIDDTRAFCSIPARHDASRRIEASFLARLVAEHRISEDRAHEHHRRPRRRLPPKGLQAVSMTNSPSPGANRPRGPSPPEPQPPPVGQGAGADRPPGPWRLPPLAPGLVHPPGRRRRGVGHRRLHRPPPRRGPGPRRAGRPLHRGGTRRRGGLLRDRQQHRRGRGRGRRRPARRTGRSPRHRRHHPDHHRGRLPARRRRQPGHVRAPDVAADLALLASGSGHPATPLGRLVFALAARRAAGAGPLAVVCCDNLANNGTVARNAVTGMAAAWDAGLAAWIEANVSFVSTSVDRITPRTTGGRPRRRRGRLRLPGQLPGGGRAVPQLGPQRRLPGRAAALGGRRRRVRGGHRTLRKPQTLAPERRALAAGLRRGSCAGTPPWPKPWQDTACRQAVERFWDEAEANLPGPDLQIPAYRAALLERFGNGRIAHHLAQIAMDGSTKLRMRAVPCCWPSAPGAGPGPRPR